MPPNRPYQPPNIPAGQAPDPFAGSPGILGQVANQNPMTSGAGLLGQAQGPFAPMGSGVNIGTPIDYSRPILQNQDGSFSTERTITLQAPNGKWYNVPTIVNGKRLPPHGVESLFLQGKIPHVGEFNTLQEAERSAVIRSQYIGQKRGK